MDNHYHLLLETPSGNLSQIMRHINGAYTTYFNVKRRRSGHLFRGKRLGGIGQIDSGGFRRFFQEGMGSGYKPWLGADFGGRIKAGDYAPELNPLAGVLSRWGFGGKWIVRVLCASIVCNIMML